MKGLPDNFPEPVVNALKHAGYTDIAQLKNVTDKELLSMHGIGPKGVRMLRELLEKMT